MPKSSQLSFHVEEPSKKASFGTCATTLYILSIGIGSLGSALNIALEVNENEDIQSRVSSRALHAFLLFFSAILFEAARTMVLSQYHLKEKKIEAGEIEMKVLQPSLFLDKPKEDLLPSPIQIDNPEALEESYLPSPLPEFPQFSLREQCIYYLRDLAPSAWFAHSLTMLVQNVIEEATLTAEVLPYTALVGLATGYLFHVSINPWPLGGIRDWVEHNRNYLTFLEWMIDLWALGYGSFRNYLLVAVIPATFWTGYNLHELTIDVLGALLNKQSSVQKAPIDVPVHYNPHLLKPLLTSASGALISGLSIWLAKQPVEQIHQLFLRDYCANWMAAIGNYAFTYPVGKYLGHYLPRRYHARALVIATYLLVPFASPELTVPHYLLMLCAGVCGGIGHAILSEQHKHQLFQMQLCKTQISQLLENAKSLAEILTQLKLPNDLLLEQDRHRKRKIVWIVSASMVGISFLFLVSLPTYPKNYLILQPLIGSLGPIFTVLGGFYLLPRGMPSIYSTNKLSRWQQLLYCESFTQLFLLKIFLRMALTTYIFRFQQDSGAPSLGTLVNEIVCLIVCYPILAKAVCKYLGGYQLYVPSSKEIGQLAAALAPEALEGSLDLENHHLSFSNHLLKFIQENYVEDLPELIPVEDDNFKLTKQVVSHPSASSFVLEKKCDLGDEKNPIVNSPLLASIVFFGVHWVLPLALFRSTRLNLCLLLC